MQHQYQQEATTATRASLPLRSVLAERAKEASKGREERRRKILQDTVFRCEKAQADKQRSRAEARFLEAQRVLWSTERRRVQYENDPIEDADDYGTASKIQKRR